MKKASQNSAAEKLVEVVTEIPPSLTYKLEFADARAKAEILQRMKEMRRQTMNVRLMPDAQLICLRDMEKGEAIIGWAGMALQFNPAYPEVFSLTLMPEYQKYMLGLYLDYARSLYLLSKGLKKVFMRISNDPSSTIKEVRLQQGFVTPLDPKSLDSGYTELCKKCELYGNECKDRLYVQVNVEKIIEFGLKRIGPLDISFPTTIRLDPTIIRQRIKKV